MDIEEKRVYDDAAGRTRLAVATGAGLAVVGVSGDVIGEFGLAARDAARDVAAIDGGRVAVATDADVLVVDLAEGAGIADADAVVESGAGAADAVAVVDDALVAAGSDGVVRRAPIEAVAGDDAGEASGADWTRLGELSVRAADGRLLAAPGGVYRVADGGVEHVGLDDARDVAAAGPFAATGEGCFRLGPGWTEELSGALDVVAASRGDGATDGRAHAASGSVLYERGRNDDEGASGDDWTEIDWPAAAPVADVAYGDGTYAVAEDGTVLADAGDGWRTRSLGLPGVRRCAVLR